MSPLTSFFFFFNDTATTEIYTLSLHDALPIYHGWAHLQIDSKVSVSANGAELKKRRRSEEHTSELQSPDHLVCRLLLEKKKRHEISNKVDMQWNRKRRVKRIDGRELVDADRLN